MSHWKEDADSVKSCSKVNGNVMMIVSSLYTYVRMRTVFSSLDIRVSRGLEMN